MARQIHAFSVTVPPGGTAAAPQAFPLGVPPLVVDEIRVRVPPGPSGRLGFALAVSGQQIIPYQAGTFLVADNETFAFPLTDFPDSGAWSVLAYNLGAFGHTISVVFYLSLNTPDVALPVSPISPDLLVP